MRYKRVFLIKPNYPGSYTSVPNWPLGLGYIAESLKTAGIEYQVIDLGFNYKNRLLYKRIREFQPHLIGIGLMTSKYKYHYALIKKLKHVFKNIPLVAGGPHISTLKEKALLDCPEIDYGVVGEGEETIIELCKGKNPAEIKGLIYKNGSNALYAGDRNRILDLDTIAFPAYAGFEIEKYDAKSINILSSRGCPYNCIYCCVKLAVGRQWIPRSAKNVADEIEYWYRREYRVFNFNDDACNIDQERMFDICDEVEKRNLKIELNAPNGARADKMSRDLLIRMKKVGFRHIAFGVEAGNNKVLANIKKGETIERIEETIKDACELDYAVKLFFLIGSPGENEQDIEDSFRLATKYPIKDVRFYNLIPFPHTELYKWIEKNNYFIQSPKEYLNGNMLWVNKPVFFTPELSMKYRKRAYKRGLKLGNRLRRKYLLEYYQKAFRKFGICNNLLAYLTSRNIFQFLLRKSKTLQQLRMFFKKNKLFIRSSS